jgi:LDH2 family malate/lactate/ureidoglycolate dehydrogenase
METLMLERTTPMDALFSFIGAERIVVSKNDGEHIGQFMAVIDPDAYDNDTDYLNAVPGMAEKILTARNTPTSEDEDIPGDWRNV